MRCLLCTEKKIQISQPIAQEKLLLQCKPLLSGIITLSLRIGSCKDNWIVLPVVLDVIRLAISQELKRGVGGV